jgi:hypothetical protein
VTPESTGPFRKSSYSGAQGNCVEVAPTATGGRAVRDSKDQRGPHLHVGPDSWRTFLTGAKNGSLGQ